MVLLLEGAFRSMAYPTLLFSVAPPCCFRSRRPQSKKSANAPSKLPPMKHATATPATTADDFPEDFLAGGFVPVPVGVRLVALVVVLLFEAFAVEAARKTYCTAFGATMATVNGVGTFGHLPIPTMS